MKKLLFLVFFILLFSFLFSDTDIYGGNVSGRWMLRNSPYIIHDNIIINNHDSLYIDQGVEIKFSGNYFFYIQGAIFADGTSINPITFTVSDTSGFSNFNDLQGSWGGIYINSALGTIRFNHTKFSYAKDLGTNGRATTDSGLGGAFCIRNAKVIFDHCTFHHNYAIDHGGAIAMLSSTDQSQFLRCNFYKNYTAGNGGGIYLESSSVKLVISDFHENRAESGNGGAIATNSSSLFTSSNLIYHNYAEYGGGIFISASDVDLYNNTICDNEAFVEGGGICHETTEAMDALNDIIYYNLPNQISFLISNTSQFSYCDIQNGVTQPWFGTGSISNAPRFVNRPTNYQISYASPCKDNGYPNSDEIDIYPYDMNEKTRIMYDRIDMGAYEYDEGGSLFNLLVDFRADITEGFLPLTVQFYNQTNYADETWMWDFGDGTTSTEKNPLHTYLTPGRYTISLTADGAGGNETQTKVNYILVKNGTHITESIVSGHWERENSPYIIDTDIEIEQGSSLIIDPGVDVLFSDNYSFIIHGALIAQGTMQDSILFSVVDTTGYSQNEHTGWKGLQFENLIYTAADNSQLDYCTIEYAKNSEAGGAVYINETADFLNLTHCRIQYSGAENGAAVAIIGDSSPTFEHCVFIHNTANVRGGAVYITQGAQPVFRYCNISKNQALTGAAIYASANSEIYIYNSLISKNIVDSDGIFTFRNISGGAFRNLTITGNVTHNTGRTLSLNDSDISMKNSIIWNPNFVQEVLILGSSSLRLDYTDIRGNWDNGSSIYDIQPHYKNNISFKLALLNADGNAKNPLIDAGDPTDDFSNEPLPNGQRINLGAYGGTSQAAYSCIVQNTDVDGNEQWNNTSLHILTRNITVGENATLMVQPGTIIQSYGNNMINILGRIVANATRGDTIIFTNNYRNSGEDQPWYGIVIESQAGENSILGNILVENALHGVTVQNTDVQLSNIKIKYDLSQNADRALSLYGSEGCNLSNLDIEGYSTGIYYSNNGRDTATPVLTNVRIRNSSSSSRDDDTGVAIYGDVAATIDSCLIEDFTIGISQQGVAGQTSSPTITNARIRNSSSSSRILQTAILLEDVNNPNIDNSIIEGYQTAIKVITTRRDISTPSISNSRIRNNPSSSRDNTTCGIYLSGNVQPDIQNNIIEDFDQGIKYQGNGTIYRDTPVLSNNRIRNSGSSSRDSLLTTGIELKNVINVTVQADSIIGYQVGVDIINNTRAVATPTLTNTRIRNSSSSSRNDTYGIKLSGSVGGTFSGLTISYYDYGIFYEGSGEATRDTPTLTNTRIRNSSSSSRTAGNIALYYQNVITSIIDSCNIEEYPVAIKMINNTRTTSTPTLTNSRIRVSPSNSRDIVKGIVLEGDFNGEISYNQIVNQDSAIVIRGINANPLIKENLIYFDLMEDDDEEAVAISAYQSNNLRIRANTIYLYDYAFISHNATAELTNIIAYKENPIYEPISESPEVTVTYSNIARPNGDLYPGTGNINDDPLFYSPKRGNFRLKTQSPCIDTGNPAFIDPDGSQSDMGKYFTPKLMDFDSQAMFGASPHHTVQFTELSTGFNENNSTWYWDIDNDGTYDIQGRNPTYDFTTPGLYTVKLKVIKNSIQDSLIKENFIVIQAEQLPSPENVVLEIQGNDIHLSWDAITWPSQNGGKYYLIYRSLQPNGDFEYVDYTNNITEFTDVNGAELQKAFYKIIAYDGSMRELLLYINRHNILRKNKLKTKDKR